MSDTRVYGLMAEFDDPEDLVVASQRAHDAGYREMDAYSPFPIHGLDDAIGFKDSKVQWMMFWGGVIGAAAGFALQAYANGMDYPINVGGRPFISWPYFFPVTFESTILLSSFAGVLGMLGLNGLPKPYHPVFNAPRFDLATQDRFFLCIEAKDPKFEIDETARFLEGLGSLSVEEVPH
jgi:hypothetical protein